MNIRFISLLFKHNFMAEKTETVPSWIKIKPAELETIVVDLAKQGKSPAQIGLVLRDKHGIPKAKLLGKKIAKILKDAKIAESPEKAIVEKKIEAIRVHMTKNKQDKCAPKSLTKRLWDLHYIKQKEA